jgi:hypothetical protein
LLTACTATIGLIFVPYALGQTGLAGVIGLVTAAAICLLSGVAAEGLASITGRAGTPLLGMLTSMAARIVPPLAICLALAAQGADGRRHLAFVSYLLVFYLATLVLETWLAVRRVATRRDVRA